MSSDTSREMHSRNRVHPTALQRTTGLGGFFQKTFSSISGHESNKDAKLGKFMANYIKMADNQPTNAYGEIDFGSKSMKTAKYVRLAHDTSPKKVFAILKEHWGLRMPNLVISLTGGAKNFTLRPRLREVFRKSLIKVAESTGTYYACFEKFPSKVPLFSTSTTFAGAWITTGGTNTGVMRHVGKAVKNYAAIRDDKDRVVTIGIASWGVIKGSDSLINSPGISPSVPKGYSSSESQSSKVMLDSNHSHFILVDDGSELKYGVEIELRAKLESDLALQSRPDQSKVLIVSVIVQGGPGSFKTVHESITKGIPVVTVEGSGGWADVLASVYNKSPKNINEELLRQSLIDANMENEANNEEKISEWTQMLKDCVKVPNLLSVFNIDPNNKAYDLDIAILEALLKANVGEKPVNEQLNLAMAWNRSDIARTHILTDDAVIDKTNVAQKFFRALKENKPGFCRLLLEYGVDLKHACVVKDVQDLYSGLPPESVVYKKLIKYNKDGKFMLQDVGKVMRDFLGHSYVTIYKNRKEGSRKYRAINFDNYADAVDSSLKVGTENHTLDDPFRELFQWALLANYREIARCIWEFMWEAMPAAIVATKMLKVLAMKTSDLDKKNQMLQDASDYENLAIGILTHCFEDNPDKSTPLLIRRLEKWGGYTCLHLAIEAHDRAFVSRPAVQYLFDTVWMGRLRDDTSTAVIILAGFLPLLILCGIFFKEHENEKRNNRAIDANGQPTGDPESAEGPHGIEMTDLENSHEDGIVVTVDPDGPAEPRRNRDDIRFNNPNVGQGSRKSQYNPIEKLILFYDAPIVTFWMNVVFFLVYLLLFAYIILSNFYPSVSVFEYVLVAWISTFFVEEIRELADQEARYFMDKMKLHICDMWNVMDVTSMALFYVGFGLRFNSDILYIARILYAISFMIQCVRIVHIFAVHPVLGPKIIMLRKMLTDLLFFLFILIVFLLAYGVASQALLYPNEGDVGTVIAGIIYKPYWLIYGELFLEEINYNPNTDDFSCSNDTSTGLPRCPEKSVAVPILSGLYLLFANVLLLNLLIAMFSYSFDKVQQQGNEIWKFQRYELITDYFFRPPLVPPFIIITHFYLLIKFIARKIRKRVRDDPFSKALIIKMTPEEVKTLTKWEHWHAEAFLQKKYQEDSILPENQMQRMSDRMDNLMSAVESLQDQMLSHKMERRKMNQLNNKMERNIERLMCVTEGGARVREIAKSVIAEPKIQQQAVKKPKESSPKPVVAKTVKMEDASPAVNLHTKARLSPYPESNVERTFVPDGQVPWKVVWKEYDPPTYTADVVLAQPVWADDGLELLSPTERPKVPFNNVDSKSRVDRTSHMGKYEVVEGLPRNPCGRTGLTGRGQLGRYGPNHAADPVITRWKRNSDNSVLRRNNKPVLEFVAILRKDTGDWAIPGGMVDPGENVSITLKREFSEEALNINLNEVDTEEKERIKKNIQLLFQSGGIEVYKGYCDDHRNTDVAWIETVARNFHDEEGTAFTRIPLKHGVEASNVSWKTVCTELKLFASHTHILQKVAESHNADF